MTDIITCEELFKNRNNFIVLDTRSPKEYEHSHIPGAITCPIMDNYERHIVGICYKEKGQEEAMKLGFEIFVNKLDCFMSTILGYGEKDIVISCSRGGLRSRLVVDMFKNKDRIIEQAKRVNAEIDFEEFKNKLDKLDKIKIFQLKGGYKEYRNFVLDKIKNYESEFGFNLIVLYGLTCTGKTEILKKLDKDGFPVIDLEGLAQHRSSLFGAVGLEPRSQKMFENLLLDKMIEIRERYGDNKLTKNKEEKTNTNYNIKVFIEGESRKIGNAHIPTELFNKMRKGIKVLVNAEMADRIKKTEKEYFDTNEKIEKVREIIGQLTKFLGRKNIELLRTKIDEKDYDFVIKFLLENYYDKKYNLERDENKYDLVIDWKEIGKLREIYSKNK